MAAGRAVGSATGRTHRVTPLAWRRRGGGPLADAHGYPPEGWVQTAPRQSQMGWRAVAARRPEGWRWGAGRCSELLKAKAAASGSPERESRMMTCREFILDFLADYLDETLRPEILVELERHLESCPPCVAYLNTYKKTRDLIKEAAPADMPQEMKAILRKFLLQQLSKEKP